MSDEIGPIDPAMLRVSNADRDRAAALLQDALEQGMITLDEYGERSAIAASAKVRAELATVLADLPTAVDQGASVAVPVVHDRPLELRAGMGTLNQVGRWTVPSRITAHCSMGNLKVDFTEAICPHREVWLDAECGWGNIKVIVPRGWTVLVESMSVGSGNLVNKANAPGDPSMPVLRVQGRVTAGNIRIKYGR